MPLSLRAFLCVFCIWGFFAVPVAAYAAQDLLQAPQDLTSFATAYGVDTVLLSPEKQAEREVRGNEIFFGPWSQRKARVSAKRFRNGILTRARGFTEVNPWSREAWASVARNADPQRYPALLGPAVVTMHADLRSMPTALPLYLEATDAPTLDSFDFFQLASLPLGTPVFISHVSADKEWLYVESPLVPGWIKADAVAVVSRDFVRRYRSTPLTVAVRDNVPLPDTGGGSLGTLWVGSVFPAAEAQNFSKIFVPVRQDDGTAGMALGVPPAGSVLLKPLPLTPGAMARLGNEMLGQAYAWGGKGAGRDCSLATRDIFFSFGIWLPRNSRSQMGKMVIPFGKLSLAERKARVLEKGKPFMTLLGFPGHIGIYVGAHQGEPVMFHNVLGLRTSNAAEDFRHIIGRCVLSTLEPGADMPELQITQSLLERLTGMHLLP